MVRLTLETDRLSMKSAYEVRLELARQEKEKVIEALDALKNEVSRLKDENALLELRTRNDPERIKLLDELATLKHLVASKEPLQEDNSALLSKVKSLEGQVQLLCVENANLKEGQLKALEDKKRSGSDLYLGREPTTINLIKRLDVHDTSALHSYERELISLREQLCTIRVDAYADRQTADRCKKERDEAVMKTKDAQESKQAMVRAVEGLQTQVGDLMAKISELEGLYEQAGLDVQEMQDQIRAKEQEIRRLQDCYK